MYIAFIARRFYCVSPSVVVFKQHFTRNSLRQCAYIIMRIIQTFQFSPYYSNFYSRIISIGPPVTVKHSSGNSFTLSRGLTVFSSLQPSSRALLFPLGGGLQSTLCLRYGGGLQSTLCLCLRLGLVLGYSLATTVLHRHRHCTDRH